MKRSFEDAYGDAVEIEATPADHFWVDARACGDSLVKLNPAMARALAADLLDEQEASDGEL